MGRAGSKSSYVDESLFGSRPAPAPVSQTGSKETAKPGQYKSALVKHTRKPEVVTLRESDLQRMLGVAAASSEQTKSSAEERKEQERAAARARKQKMLQLAKEAEQQAPPSDLEVARAAADNASLSRAQQLLDEEKDEVKRMNQMALYAKCVSIRDKQVQEKAAAMLADEAEQKRLDLEMEVERIKALQAYQARDVQRREEQARSAAILREQLAERGRQRLQEEEARDQERQQMVAELERLQHEAAAAAAAKKQRAAALLQEVAAANEEQIARKQLLAEQEREEEMRIARYIMQKDAREQALAAEATAVAHQKELETARLRALQERQADHQSEQDELRARRYQEAKEREWRAREAAAAQRQAQMMADLAAAREAQLAAKTLAQATLAEVDQAEFRRLLGVTQERAAQDASQAVARQALNEAYKRDLLSQIQAREEAKRAERCTFVEKGRKQSLQEREDKAALEQARRRKLQELELSGVPPKYLAELAHFKI